MQLRAVGALDAVIRPQRLRAVGQGDAVERGTPGVAGGERDVIDRVPVLSDHDVAKLRAEAVDHRHQRIASRDGQRATGHEPCGSRPPQELPGALRQTPESVRPRARPGYPRSSD
uniref:Uncharacterized protein n=1 Tax=Tanacetum cinerariifolium TaxID=118510 RepID=A0A699UN63_TANCI|nr:hypothetical protein [Tanacetum cinerariifolium]